MPVHTFNPLEDLRWTEFVEGDSRSSVFHSIAWLRALKDTYGYDPVVYTTTPPGRALTNGMVFSCVRSWLTGSRMVSLPFADHCEPLLASSEEALEIVNSLQHVLNEQNVKYIEIRPLTGNLTHDFHVQETRTFHFHVLDLRPSIDTVYRACHKESIQRKVRRAEREGISYEDGSSEQLLSKFYRLLVVTRRRHQLPPQPIQWFRNLISAFRDQITIRVASYRERAIASVLTLRNRDSMVYKYGCSDASYHNVGGMPFLLWNAIQDAKSRGLRIFDFGRSDTGNEGLIRFKNAWGTTQSTVSYRRMGLFTENKIGEKRSTMKLINHVFSILPDGLLTAAGKFLYRHIA